MPLRENGLIFCLKLSLFDGQTTTQEQSKQIDLTKRNNNNISGNAMEIASSVLLAVFLYLWNLPWHQSKISKLLLSVQFSIGRLPPLSTGVDGTLTFIRSVMAIACVVFIFISLIISTMASFCLWATKLGAVFSSFHSMRTFSAVTAANTLCSSHPKQIQENPIETELVFVSLGMLQELEPCISYTWNTCILKHFPLNLCWGFHPSEGSFRNYSSRKQAAVVVWWERNIHQNRVTELFNLYILWRRRTSASCSVSSSPHCILLIFVTTWTSTTSGITGLSALRFRRFFM